MKNCAVKTKIMKISFKEKHYKIEVDKILYVLSRLLDKNINMKSENEILKLMNKFKLFDEIFLSNMEKI